VAEAEQRAKSEKDEADKLRAQLKDAAMADETARKSAAAEKEQLLAELVRCISNVYSHIC
jgi:hypothetical protein